MRLPSLQDAEKEGRSLLSGRFEEMLADWAVELSSKSPELGRLFMVPAKKQLELGYYHTLREIYQQPLTWLETAVIVPGYAEALNSFMSGAGIREGEGAVILTGSGSSEFVGNCLEYALQSSLGVPVRTFSSGILLTHPFHGAPPNRPSVMVSIARSGDSPESCGTLELLLEKNPLCRHLIITANPNGRLATSHIGDPRVFSLILDEKTCDQSLVMTSSFTNMVLAGQFLGMVESPQRYSRMVEELAQMVSMLQLRYSSTLASVAQLDFKSVIYLGSGGRYGAARESALKMLEMTAGQVMTFAETYLGLRHGPMSAVLPDTLVVCFLSSDPLVRAYEMDLISELNRKGLGLQKVIVGDHIPGDIIGSRDLVVECPGMARLGDENVAVLDAVVGQILGFFHCMRLGLKPDSPSTGGVISRVVGSFTIHRREQS